MAGKRFKKPEPMEMKKKFALWAFITAALSTIVSYLLAAFDKQPVESVTNAIIAACAVIVTAYITAATFDKNSRNKYRIRRDGTPYDQIGGYNNDNHDDTQ